MKITHELAPKSCWALDSILILAVNASTGNIQVTTTTLIASVPHYCCCMQAPYCHVVLVVTSFLTGRCSVRISRLLSDLQPLECHVFCSQPEIMHSQWVPMPGGEEEEEEEGSFGTYSHYGEFQALMRKWINREVGTYLAPVRPVPSNPLYAIIYISSTLSSYSSFPSPIFFSPPLLLSSSFSSFPSP